ncbi:class 1 fructose-bisphosphatase [Salinarimonas sp.]|uniref:class 1 fructose-bisphosphatase n=1 Tax=Salinarimonas sp. TaxID=2766526 RepID=UPI0032D90F9C
MTHAPLETRLPDTGPLRETVLRLAEAGARVADLVARGPLAGDLDAAVGDSGAHEAGDAQKHLDLVADRLFHEALAGAPVAWLASEERAEVEALAPGAPLAVALDPLDGSSNIAVNAPLGAIFSILPAIDDPLASFLRPGAAQVAAGFLVFGPTTALVLTLGAGVDRFVLDREAGRFRLAQAGVRIPTQTREFAINASNRRHWAPGLRAFFDDCLLGREGALGADQNMRWIASLVAEAYRILVRGGVFLYPADARRGYEAGRLRRLYEASPMAFVVEQAGGRATDDRGARILDQAPASLHQRTPLVFGSADMVGMVARYVARA